MGMISPELRELLRPALRVNAMLRWILTASIFVYGLAACLVLERSPAPAVVSELFHLAFGCVAILTGLGSLLVERVLLSDARLQEAMRSDPDPEALARDPRRGIVDGERLQKIQSLTSAERKLLRLCGLFFASFIIRLSMNEAIAIYGVVLAFLSRSLIPMLPFAVAAIALNVACRPRIDPFLERATYLAR